jgi:hypothetical protein
MSATAAPFRLCCGRQHFGPVCSDGKVMCQLCFGRFDVEDLNVVSIDFEGQHEDVCRSCAASARTIHLRKEHDMTGPREYLPLPTGDRILQGCPDCGSIVYDTALHDEFHKWVYPRDKSENGGTE